MTDHNPADTITAAAKLLRKRAAVATAGPWVASTVRSPRATVTSGIYSHAHPAGSTASEIAASGRKGRGCGGVTNPDNAEYIALMHPAVGDALANWLESAARDAEQIGPDPFALAVAGQLLGEPPVSAPVSRRMPIHGSGYTPAQLLGGES